jgi:hypothetical protein
MAAVYLRCNPRTYEVFLTEQEQSILPDCSKLGTNLKFGRTCNTNGVFVLLVVFSCLCDSHLLEENLRAHFSSSRIANTQEYLSLTSLRRLFKEPHARGLLAKVKDNPAHLPPHLARDALQHNWGLAGGESADDRGFRQHNRPLCSWTR